MNEPAYQPGDVSHGVRMRHREGLNRENTVSGESEHRVVEALRNGDEQAFLFLGTSHVFSEGDPHHQDLLGDLCARKLLN